MIGIMVYGEIGIFDQCSPPVFLKTAFPIPKRRVPFPLFGYAHRYCKVGVSEVSEHTVFHVEVRKADYIQPPRGIGLEYTDRMTTLHIQPLSLLRTDSCLRRCRVLHVVMSARNQFS